MNLKLNKQGVRNISKFLNGKALLKYKSTKFSYAIHKIRKTIDLELESINKAINVTEIIKALKLPDNENFTYDELKILIDKSDKFDQEEKDTHKKKLDENLKFLEEEIELNIYDLKLDMFPDDVQEGDFRILGTLIAD